MKTGKLFIISAPSGTGKTTLLKKVMAEIPGIEFSVSHTTRKPRPGETDGKDYYFVDHQSFEQLISEDQFLEWAEVHGNYYGTSKGAVEKKQVDGVDVVLDIDVQGAAILREKAILSTVFVFIAPPSIEELEKRLRGRGTDAAGVVTTRMENARKEMESVAKYDHVIVNDNLEEAATMLGSIILAERSRSRRQFDGSLIYLSV